MSDVFDQLVAELEILFSRFGSPYQRGSGDFLINQDNYGVKEVAVILCAELPIKDITAGVQQLLTRTAPAWRVRIGATAGLEWNGDQDLVIAADRIWSETRDGQME